MIADTLLVIVTHMYIYLCTQ